MSRLELSVVVIALNEAAKIRCLLDSVVEWAGEIVVVDMQSGDETASIARDYGAKVFEQKRIEEFDRARRFAVEQATNDWVLVLDADEEVSPGLRKRITGIIDSDLWDVVKLPFANLAFSGFGPHESGFPEYHARLFRKSSMKIADYEGKLHSFFEPKIGARITRIKGSFPSVCVRHYTNSTISEFVSKVNRYTSVEAAQRYGRYESRSKFVLHVLLKPLRAAFVHLFTRRGYLDGWRGIWLSLIFVFYELLIMAKVWEMRLHNGSAPTHEVARERMRDYVKRLERAGPHR